MSQDVAISVRGLGKQYPIRVQASGSLYDNLARVVGAKAIADSDEPTRVWAIRDVTFEVPRGHVLGVIGRNGSGKSTLMRILARITAPTEGRAVLRGRVGALLDVGTGFHPELSGRENIRLSGAIHGVTRRDLAELEHAINEFAEIGRFVDAPVKHYSSGMYLRLAFSVAAHMPAPIMLLDEVLAVGDTAFQLKCRERILSIARDGRTVLLVSHDMSSVLRLCQSVLVLDAGSARYSGPALPGVRYYIEDVLGLDWQAMQRSIAPATVAQPA